MDKHARHNRKSDNAIVSSCDERPTEAGTCHSLTSKSLVIGRVTFAIISSLLIIVAGGGYAFLGRPIGALYIVLWAAYWLVQAERPRGEPSEYDKKQRAVYLSGVFIIPALILGVPWEYISFRGPIPRDGPSALLGLVIFGLGVVIMAAAIRSLGSLYTSYLGIQSNHHLVTDGPYRFVRHPGYLGEILSMFGIGLSLSSLLGLGIAVISVILILPRMRIEEEMLLDNFGDAYRSYANRTYRLIPWVY